jgi:hypothetical protein
VRQERLERTQKRAEKEKRIDDYLMAVTAILRPRFQWMTVPEINNLIPGKTPSLPTCKKYLQELVDLKILRMTDSHIKETGKYSLYTTKDCKPFDINDL